MKAESRAHLHDALQAARSVKQFVVGRTFADYASTELVRSAVERLLQHGQ